jgi:signal peptidase II
VRVLWLTAGIVIADQCTKLWVKGITIPWLGVDFPGMAYGASRPVWGNLLRFTYIENPGMAFGIDIGGKLFFALFSIIASIGIAAYLFRVRHEGLGFRTALAMILGGAIGNLVDRVFYGVLFHTAPLFHGRVVDFIDMNFFEINVWGYHLSRFPVFNIADTAVTLGVVLLVMFHRLHPAEEIVTAKQEVPAPHNDNP